LQLLASAIQELQQELGETSSATAGFFCLTVAPFMPNEPAPEVSDCFAALMRFWPLAATCCFFANLSSTK